MKEFLKVTVLVSVFLALVGCSQAFADTKDFEFQFDSASSYNTAAATGGITRVDVQGFEIPADAQSVFMSFYIIDTASGVGNGIHDSASVHVERYVHNPSVKSNMSIKDSAVTSVAVEKLALIKTARVLEKTVWLPKDTLDARVLPGYYRIFLAPGATGGLAAPDTFVAPCPIKVGATIDIVRN